MRRVLAAAALTVALTPLAASADPVPYPPPPIPVGSYCVIHWVPVYIFSDDVPVPVYVPRMAC